MSRGMVRAWLRLFAIQGSWNYERMQGAGAAWAIEPMLRGLRDGPDPRYRAALGRAAQAFNANPYLAGLAIAAVARAEHEGVEAERIERFKVALTGPLGSVGDRLVWAAALPAASAVGLVLAAVARGWWLPAAGFLLAYNLVHLTLRTWSLRTGWRGGAGVTQALARPVVQGALRIAGPLPGLAVGFALPLAATWLTADLASGARVGVFLLAGLGVVVGRWLAPTLGGLRFGLWAVGITLLAEALWPSSS